MTDADQLRATGRIVGAATNTAAFVRAQLANGVSIETLRRRLGIRPEHMLDMLTHAPEPPLPKPVLARELKQAPTGGWGAKAESRAGIGKADSIRKAMEDRAEARRVLRLVLPIVVSITRFDSEKIKGCDKGQSATNYRAMVIALMHEIAPRCPLIAIGKALNRQANVVERALARCERMRGISTDFNAQYLSALSRLAL